MQFMKCTIQSSFAPMNKLYTWRPLVEGDEQLYRPHGKSS